MSKVYVVECPEFNDFLGMFEEEELREETCSICGSSLFVRDTCTGDEYICADCGDKIVKNHMEAKELDSVTGYPEWILAILRESVNIDRYDTQHDEEFNTKWSKDEVFDSVMRYEATYNPTKIKEFIRDIYGVDLFTKNPKDDTKLCLDTYKLR
jgi:predicted RNA-binding Zn-ribbon protein involved in translation (DUF1610 family)